MDDDLDAAPGEQPSASVGAGHPSAGVCQGTPGAGKPSPAFAGGVAEGGDAEPDAAPGPDPAVTARNVAALAQAVGKALEAGGLDTALAALDAAREQAARDGGC